MQRWKQHKCRRRGFTMMELCLCAAILALLLPIVAQLGYWSLMQRVRAQAEQAALELAQNVLDSARSQPMEDLTAWASAQKIPEDIAPLLPDARLIVKIEPEKHHMVRLTVTVAWQTETASPRRLQLTTLLAPRAG